MRPLLYATLFSLLVILAVIGAIEVRSFREEYETRERQRMQELLDDALEQWEAQVESRIADLREGLVENADRETTLARLRQANDWMDAVYLWEGADLVYPPEVPAEDIASLRADPCLAAAGAAPAGTAHLDAARRYLSCVSDVDPVSAFATSEAVDHLLAAGEPTVAWQLLRRQPSAAFLRLDRAGASGISPYRVVLLRFQYLDALRMRGEIPRAQVLFAEMVAEILLQDGPVLDSIERLYEYPIAPALEDGAELPFGDVDEVWARVWRRLAAWRDVREWRWTEATLAPLRFGPRLVPAPEGDPPYLLYVQAAGPPGGVVAYQLDQEVLLRSFLRGFGRAALANLTVRDANRVVFGRDQPYLVYRNFSRVLPSNLTVGFTEAALPLSEQDRAMFAQLALIVMGLVVGVAALWGMVRSDRETRHLLDAQREFLTRVTHELKTPLAGIRLMAETLEMGAWREREDVEKAAARIMGEADRLHRRVDEVLAASRGALNEDPVPVDVVSLLEGLADSWRPRVEQVGGTLTLTTPPALRVIARPALLRDALTNLLDNALKYRREDRPLQVRVLVRTERRTVVFEVVDNGIGVPPNARAAVFERFRRVEGPGRGKAGGHGLGLAFVADAARAHGGRVECREGVDGGARFVLRVPFKPAPPAASRTRSS